ncbi:hypothetical protein F4808DRAFT_130596 [Astrocystis sublimbata]|nr:hypothetical protein F4808DRAFT_130596 [Astrocystis sublimbata]
MGNPSNPYYDPTYQPYTPSVLIGSAVFFTILTIVSVALRFYARLSTAARFGVDDWLIIPAALICIGTAAGQIYAATAGGVGGHQHLDENGLPGHTEQLYIYEKTRYAVSILGNASFCLIRLSVLFFYRRIFHVRTFITINNIVLGFSAVFAVAFTFILIFQCNPPSAIWEKLETEYGDSCLPVLPLYLSYIYIDLGLDVLTFVLPIPHILGLKLPTRQKIGVASIFLLGSLVVGINITRAIIYSYITEFASDMGLQWLSDLTWYNAGILFWQLAQISVGILGACMPSFAVLFRRTVERSRNKSTGHSEGNTLGSSHRRIATQLSTNYERIDEPTLLERQGTAKNANTVYEEHALYPLPPAKKKPDSWEDDANYHTNVHAVV